MGLLLLLSSKHLSLCPLPMEPSTFPCYLFYISHFAFYRWRSFLPLTVLSLILLVEVFSHTFFFVGLCQSNLFSHSHQCTIYLFFFLNVLTSHTHTSVYINQHTHLYSYTHIQIYKWLQTLALVFLSLTRLRSVPVKLSTFTDSHMHTNTHTHIWDTRVTQQIVYPTFSII